MNMKIYFAGSIRGGRIDAGLYRRMIDFIQREDRVLTEHVGAQQPTAVGAEACDDAEIYRQDTSWLRESDMLIGEATCPSLGVGYELAYAERMGIPCHVFYNPERCRLSAMIGGDDYFNVYPYHSEEELFEQLSRILGRQK